MMDTIIRNPTIHLHHFEQCLVKVCENVQYETQVTICAMSEATMPTMKYRNYYQHLIFHGCQMTDKNKQGTGCAAVYQQASFDGIPSALVGRL